MTLTRQKMSSENHELIGSSSTAATATDQPSPPQHELNELEMDEVQDHSRIGIDGIINCHSHVGSLTRRHPGQSRRQRLRASVERRRHRLRLSSTVLLAARSLPSFLPAALALPMSNSVTGGYLTHPPSRNYLAWTSNALLPTSSRPLSSLPEWEPTPHNLVIGPTCGAVDGSERNYDLPMSREEGVMMPLNVQAVYSHDEASGAAGVEVQVSLFGIDGGGHFEFHACPLTYPETPTEECFERYPLAFVEDEYYGAVPDAQYPERAYVPYLGVFSSNGFSGGWEPVRDEHVGPGGGEMMEFKYRLRFPDEEALWTEMVDILPQKEDQGGNRGRRRRRTTTTTMGRRMAEDAVNHEKQEKKQALQDQQDEGGVAIQTIDWASNGISPPDVDWAFQGSAPAGTDWGQDKEFSPEEQEVIQQQDDVKEEQAAQVEDNMKHQQGQEKQQSLLVQQQQKIEQQQQQQNQQPEQPLAPEPQSQTAATTTPESESPPQALDPEWAADEEVPEGYPDIFWAEDLDTDWAVELQNEHDANPPPPQAAPDPPNTGIAPEGMSDNTPDGAVNVDNILAGEELVPISSMIDLDNLDAAASEPEAQSAVEDKPKKSNDLKIPPSSDKYVLLRWHYVTARDCHPPGYDTYTWPTSWGPWNRPWGGECKGTEHYSSTEYFNCAEVMILGPDVYMPTGMPTPSPIVNLDVDEEPILVVVEEEPPAMEELSSGTPEAVSDLVFIGVSEVAFLDVLQNDVDPDGDELSIEAVTVPEEGGAIHVKDGGMVLEYTPQDGFVGVDSFEYKVCDPSHLCDTGTVEVVVGPVIDLIFAMDDIANVTAGETIKVDVTANDVIRVNATLNITEVRGGRFGTCVITSDNQIEYTADEDRVGADRCDYVVCLEEFCDKGRLEVEVIAPLVTLSNAAPLAKPDTVTINVNELALIDPLRNDEDEDGDDLTITEVSSPSNGDVEIVGGGTSLEYMPDDQFTGVDDFTYTVCDTSNLCDTANIRVIVRPSLKAVKAVDDAILTGFELPVKVDVVANDEVLGDEIPTVTKVDNPFNGKCEVTDDNQVLFTPKDSFEGWGRCSYTVCVGDVCDDARLKIKVFKEYLIDRPEGEELVEVEEEIVNEEENTEEILDIGDFMTANLSPVANDDTVILQTNEFVVVDVLSNDEGVDGDELMVNSISQAPVHGDARVVNGSVHYIPDKDFTGLDSFQYTACDTSERCDSATVDVTVIEPIVVTVENDRLITHSDSPKSVNVLKNDSVNRDIPLELIDASVASNGRCDVTEDYDILYTPDPGFAGWDRCFYTVCAGEVCEEGKVGIKVFPANTDDESSLSDEPVPIQASASGIEVFAVDDHAATATEIISIDVTANDSTNSYEPLKVVEALPALHGQCEVTDSNKVRYIPDGDFDGWDKCSYTVCAGDVCDDGIIEIKVLSTPIYDMFTVPTDVPLTESIEKLSSEIDLEKVYAEDELVVTSINTPITVDVTSNDFVKGMELLKITHTGGSKNGLCEITSDNKVMYTPDEDFVGQDQCGYIVCNEQTMCDEGILTIKVTRQKTASKEMELSAAALETNDEDIIVNPNGAKVCAHAKSRSDIGGRKLSTDGSKSTSQACVGDSLITIVTQSSTGEILNYTSTFHYKVARSISPRDDYSDLSVLRFGRSASINAMDNSYTETVISLPASEDASIVPGFPDQNFGMSPSLLVNSEKSAGGRFDSVLQFRTNSVDPSVCSSGIMNAKVLVYSLASTAHGGIFSTTSNQKWSEQTVTWNNGPRGDGILLIRLGPVKRNQWYEVDVSSALHLGQPLSIRITSDAESSAKAQYVSRNNDAEALRPVLKITCLSFDGATEGDV
ncbi:hypothetical protein ACHAXS_014267 [Conticribra weissflogii]